MAFEVGDGQPQSLNRVASVSEKMVAVVAEELPQLTRLVIMVDMHPAISLGRTLAESTQAALLGHPLVVLLKRYAVQAAQALIEDAVLAVRRAISRPVLRAHAVLAVPPPPSLVLVKFVGRLRLLARPAGPRLLKGRTHARSKWR